MKTRKNPYGFPILGTIAAVAAVAGWAKNASDNKDAENREKEAKAEADKEKEKQKLIERQEKTTQSLIDAVNSGIQLTRLSRRKEIASDKRHKPSMITEHK